MKVTIELEEREMNYISQVSLERIISTARSAADLGMDLEDREHFVGVNEDNLDQLNAEFASVWARLQDAIFRARAKEQR